MYSFIFRVANEIISSQISKFFNVKPVELEKNACDSIHPATVFCCETNNEEFQVLPAVNIEEKLAIYKHTSEKIVKLSECSKQHEKLPSNSISKFLKINKINESLEDFEEPKRSKLTHVKSLPLKKPTKLRAKRQNNYQKNSKKISDEKIFAELMSHQSRSENVDPDEMQMALALSMSIAESFNVENKINKIEDKKNENIKSGEDRLTDIQHTLEKFGFKSGFSTVDLNTILNVNKRSKNRRKFSRKNIEYFKKPFEEKVNNICLNNLNNSLNSEEVAQYNILSKFLSSFDGKREYFLLQSTDIETKFNYSAYYVGELIEKSNVKCGSLLKDWNKIPGRDKSPIRLNNNKNNESDCGSLNVESDDNAMNMSSMYLNKSRQFGAKSPDMFSCSESDEESNAKRMYTQ